jgi:Recombination endonuclease VII
MSVPRTDAQKEAARLRHYRWVEANRDKVRAWNRAYYEANREKVLARHKARYQEKNRERARTNYDPARESARHRQRKYGLSARDYDEMVAQQGSRCAVCGREQELVVDHCHRSGVVRALLCDPCNRGLGFFAEEPERMEAAIRYLERFRDLEAPQLRLVFDEETPQ